MPCAESLRVHAYFDGEMDATAAVNKEKHLMNCEECRSLLQDLRQSRDALRKDLSNFRASSQLRARIAKTLEEEQITTRARNATKSSRQSKPFWWGALSGMGVTAVAAMLTLLLLASPTNRLADEVLNAHVHSLMTSHLIDVESTDRHTVKPWFAGRVDFSPAVADFELDGYKLIGGRVDDVGHQHTAVVVYQHGLHMINVFSWAHDRQVITRDISRHGYHMIFWKSNDVEYCAVSDMGWDELRGLVHLLQDTSRRNS